MAPKGPDREEWTIGCLMGIVIVILLAVIIITRNAIDH